MIIQNLRLKILFICYLFSPLALFAQLLIDGGFSLSDPAQVHIVHTVRGDILSGRVTAIQDTIVFFQFKQDALSYSFQELSRIEVLGSKNSDRFHQPLSRRVEMQGYENLLLSPTAYALPQGTFEYRNVQGLANTVDVGVSDNFSLGGGLVVPILLIVRSKLAFPVGSNFNLGIGGSGFFSIIDNTKAAHFYGAFTVGQSDRFLNVTAGTFVEFSRFSNDESFIVTVGGVRRIGNRWRLMADFVFIPAYADSGGFLPTAGVGWFTQRHRIDFGLSVVGDPGFVRFPFPYFAYGLRFGKIR